MTASTPLQWPAGRPRRRAGDRKRSKFKRRETGGAWPTAKDLSIADALRRLQDELDRVGARHAVVSSNVETRLDGLPRSGLPEPSDPGVAVYFDLGGTSHCFPCDTYTTVAGNIAAVAAHIEATRAIERHGVASIREMFTGFAALPAQKAWFDVLGVSQTASRDEVERAFREKARRAHPDTGGSNAAMAELNAARDAGLKERANG